MSRLSSASRGLGTGASRVRIDAATPATIAPLSSGSSAIAPDADAERPEWSPVPTVATLARNPRKWGSYTRRDGPRVRIAGSLPDRRPRSGGGLLGPRTGCAGDAVLAPGGARPGAIRWGARSLGPVRTARGLDQARPRANQARALRRGRKGIRRRDRGRRR